MSAVSLKYPLKPNDLADDLESFIYVITYCSLRFHRHNWTLLRPDTPDAKLVQINATNADLRDHVNEYFHRSVVTNRGLLRGGNDKMLCATAGKLDWNFISGYVSTALENLVARLYDILKEHYKRIDANALKKYSGEGMHLSCSRV